MCTRMHTRPATDVAFSSLDCDVACRRHSRCCWKLGTFGVSRSQLSSSVFILSGRSEPGVRRRVCRCSPKLVCDVLGIESVIDNVSPVLGSLLIRCALQIFLAYLWLLRMRSSLPLVPIFLVER